MRKLVVLGAIILFLVGFIFVTQGASNYKSKADIEVINSVRAEGKAHVILHTDKKELNTISREKIKYKFSSGDYEAVINQDDLNRLIKDGSVTRIENVYNISAFLQDSVSITNASLSWSRSYGGYNLTGVNQTVCVIDTGVNYNTADLGGCYGNNNPASTCKVVGGYDFVNNDADPIDDNGHGTHVAGIIAANGSIKGVAPDARIVAVKVLDSVGGGNSIALKKGIDWCVGNASRYNIVAISMSLGTTTLYSGYCDSSSQSLADSINSAAGAGISIVAATGNSGEGIPRNTTHISNPACIENVTRVSATNKDDSIASYAHYNNLVKLFAPGTSINSTYLTGYREESGTSMATPHVAGAIALIREFLSLESVQKTPPQIESSLNSSGKTISDGSLYFSRINIYNTLVSLDSVAPSVSLISPANRYSTTASNVSFGCNASDFALKNVSFYLWNSSGIYNLSSSAVSGSYGLFSVNMSNISAGAYNWSCRYFDEKGNSAFGSNYSLNIANITAELKSPANNTYTNENLSYNCSSQSVNVLKNVSFYLWNSTGLENYSYENISGNSNSSVFYYNFTREGNYTWNCLFVNDLSQGAYSSSNYTVFYDLTKPEINISFPEGGYSVDEGTEIEFYYNVSDNISLSECGLIVDGSVVALNSSAIDLENYITYSEIGSGTHLWQINCTDLAGNVGNSSSRTIIINEVQSGSQGESQNVASSSSGGGGGGGAPVVTEGKIYSITSEQLSGGFSGSLKKSDSVKFNIKGENHSIEIEGILNNKVSVVIRSDPLKISLASGESRRINLTTGEYYDFEVRADFVNSTEARIVLKSIWEKIKTIEGNVSLETKEINKVSDKKESHLEYVILIGVMIFLILLVAFLRNQNRKRYRKMHGKKKL